MLYLKHEETKVVRRKKQIGDSEIYDSKDFFKNIYKKGEVNFKAEYAINLLEVLKDNVNRDKRNKFNVPKYIKDGFTHIVG